MLIVCGMCSGALGDLYESSLVPKDEARFAEEYLAQLRKKNYTYVKSVLGKKLSAQANDEGLDKLVGYFRKGELISTELIGSQVREFPVAWQGAFTFEYQFTDGWNLASAVLMKDGDKIQVAGLSVYQTRGSQKEMNRFTISGKSTMQYVVLTLSLAVPIFILITLVYCIKTPIKKRKWLWVIFILVGVGAFRINWTTGAYAFQIMNVQLLGAGILAAGEYAPWIIKASFPLGAIVFWCKRRKLIEPAIANQRMHQTPDGAGDP